MAQPRVALFEVSAPDTGPGEAHAFLLDLDDTDVAAQIGNAVMGRLAAVPLGGTLTYTAHVYPVDNLPPLP